MKFSAVLFCTAAMFHQLISGASQLPAAELPDDAELAYRFQAGQELVYQGFDTFEYERGALLSAHRWRFIVVDATSDHGSQILLIQATARGRRDKDEDPQQAREKLMQQFESDAVEGSSPSFKLARFEINHLGRISNPSGLRWMHPQISRLLIELPTPAERAKDRWTREDTVNDETLMSRLIAPHESGIDLIETTSESVMNDVYESTEKLTTKFDRHQGRPTEILSEYTQKFGFDGQSHGKTELMDTANRPLDWIRTCHDESSQFVAINQEYERLTSCHSLTSMEIEPQLKKCREQLLQLIDGLRTDFLKTALTGIAKDWEREIEWAVEEIRTRESVVGAASEVWKTTDLAGKEYSLKDLEGKVVVLDFWYRGCGWCIRAMPQVQAVSEHYRGQPVAVVGMNQHDTLEEATPVINRLKLDYLQFKAGKINEQYKVSGYPTLVILDQHGVVRDLHVGYSPTLKEDVVKTVDSLLKK